MMSWIKGASKGGSFKRSLLYTGYYMMGETMKSESDEVNDDLVSQ